MALASAVLGVASGGEVQGGESAIAGPLRLFLVVDVSAPMGACGQLDIATAAARNWVAALPESPNLTVDLVEASDHASHLGSFDVAVDGQRDALLRALQSLRPRRAASRSLRRVDSDVAEIVTRRAGPAERVGVVILTGFAPDSPGDLRPGEIGEVRSVAGLTGITVGKVPRLDALDPQPRRVPAAKQARRKSTLRILLTPAVRITGPTAVRAEPERRFLGGVEAVVAEVLVTNEGTLVRKIEIDAQAPAGGAITVVPREVVADPGARLPVRLEIRTDGSLGGSLALTASTPDGVASRLAIDAFITPRGWLRSNLVPVGGLGSLAAVAAVLGAWWIRRPVVVAAAGHADRCVELRPGDQVPLRTLDPEFPAGPELRRRLRGFQVRAGDVALTIAGVPVKQPGWTTYRPRQALEAGGRAVVVHEVAAAPVAAVFDVGRGDPLSGLR